MQISALKSAYDLSAKLQPQHSGNVKAVIAVGENRPATASRDQSVAIWERDASQVSVENRWFDEKILVEQERRRGMTGVRGTVEQKGTRESCREKGKTDQQLKNRHSS